jgi:hypothetical protein
MGCFSWSPPKGESISIKVKSPRGLFPKFRQVQGSRFLSSSHRNPVWTDPLSLIGKMAFNATTLVIDYCPREFRRACSELYALGESLVSSLQMLDGIHP